MRNNRRKSGFTKQTNAGVDQRKSIKRKNKRGKRRSRQKPKLIRKNLLQFRNNSKLPKNFRDDSKRPKDENLDQAIEWAHCNLKLPEKVKMLHLCDVFNKNDLDIWDKSPGLPWRNIGYRTKGDIRKDPKCINQVRHFWHQIKLNDYLPAPNCFAYVSFDMADTGETGMGVVSEYPATMTFGEAVFAIPLISGYQQSSKIFAYGYEEAVGGMEKIVDRFGSYSYYAGLDFKDFNKTVPAWLIQIAFDILYLSVDFVHFNDYGISDQVRMNRMWDYIVDYFINTPIETTDGKILNENSGIPSDSLFTQLIASIINCILCQWICLDQSGILATDILVQDHKSIIATNIPLRHGNANNLLDSIGIQINPFDPDVAQE